MFNIIRAKPDNSLAIATVHVKSWQETYTNIFSEQYLKNLSVENRKKQWDRLLTNPDVFTFVVKEHNMIVGFFSLEKRNYPQENSPYLASLYLLKKYQGRGIGKEMFFYSRNFWHSLNYNFMYIECLEQNSTLSFYKKFGSVVIEKIKNNDSPKLTELLLKNNLY